MLYLSIFLERLVFKPIYLLRVIYNTTPNE